MKKPDIKALPAVAFLLSLLALFVVGLRPFLVSAYVGSGYLRGLSSSVFKNTEEVFNEQLPTKDRFVDVNSFLSRVTGRRTEGSYVKLNNGRLAYVVDKIDTAPYADAVVSLSDYVQDTVKKPFLFVMFPCSIDPADKQLPPGTEDHSDENADDMVAQLRAKGVPVYDMRPYFQSQPDYYSQFYRTDHHWKAETAFSAAQELLGYLTANDPSFAVDKQVTDPAGYQTETRDNFLGSLGRHMGRYYCGLEAFSAISPSFPLDLEVYDLAGERVAAGDAVGTVLFPDKLTYKSHYWCDMYSYYMGKDYDYRRYVNRTSGLKVAPKKILVIKDSYANAMLPYLIYGCREVTTVDMRSLKEPLAELIRKEDPDLTVVAYTSVMLRTNTEDLFRFFP